MRLVVNRVLYDGGVQLAHSPSMQALVGTSTVGVSPSDAARLGVADGDRVTLEGPDASLTLPVRVDDKVARGTVVMRHGLGSTGPAPLLAAAGTAVDVRVEVA
jgi:anaerobic selenocysteine-containing dehydrogenase